MEGRTIVLVSHHVQLTAPGADYVVNLENGRVKFEGTSQAFLESGGYKGAEDDEEPIEDKKPVASKPKPKNKALADLKTESAVNSEASSASEAESDSESEAEIEALDKKIKGEKKAARKLIDDEATAVGAVKWDVWTLFIKLMGGVLFWLVFVFAFGGAKVFDVAQTFWLNLWAASCELHSRTSFTRSL